jgi:hypothetical protein
VVRAQRRAGKPAVIAFERLGQRHPLVALALWYFDTQGMGVDPPLGLVHSLLNRLRIRAPQGVQHGGQELLAQQDGGINAPG